MLTKSDSKSSATLGDDGFSEYHQHRTLPLQIVTGDKMLRGAMHEKREEQQAKNPALR